ncbi:MAG: hypothetical protein LVS60_15630 [Nodosilinea sp. LVE1205-7]
MLEPFSDSADDYIDYCEQVSSALAGFPKGSALAEALLQKRTFIYWISYDEISDVTDIKVKQGHGAHSLEAETINTEFQAYLETVIDPQIRLGILTNGAQPGSYDDRKVRWSGAGASGFWTQDKNTLILEVGPTSYPLCHLDIHRHPVDALKLMLRGLKTYQDPYAYFARGMGIVVVPLTNSGHVYLGKRSQTTDYKDVLSFISGWAKFSSNLNEINFYQDAQRELREEIHLKMILNKINTQFIGIAGNPITGEVDLVFVTQTELADEYFKSGDWPEHSNWYGICNSAEARLLLEEGRLSGKEETYDLMFSSRLGLEYLLQHHW